MTIPKIFIRKASWKYNDLPQILKDIYNESLTNNPVYELKYFDDDDADNFIETNFPQYIKYYRELIPKAYNCDIFRLLALYYYGGIYMDCALKLLKSIKDIIHEDDELIFVKEHFNQDGINNSFIAAKPNHPIMLEIVNYIIDNRLKVRNKGRTPLDITGPTVIGEFLKNYSKEYIRYFQFKHDFIYKPLDNIVDIYKHRKYHSNNNKSFYDNNPSVLSCNYENCYILNEHNEQIIKNKFEGYYNLVYNNHLEYHYDNLWKNNIIFSNTYNTSNWTN